MGFGSKFSSIFACALVLGAGCSHSNSGPGGGQTLNAPSSSQSTPPDQNAGTSPPNSSDNAPFGKCLISTSTQKYKNLWSDYDVEMRQKVILNIPLLRTMPMPADVSQFVSAINALHPVITALNQIKDSSWMTSLYSDPSFAQKTSPSSFLSQFEQPTLAAAESNLLFLSDYSNTSFKRAIDSLVLQLKKSDVQAAIQYFGTQELSFITPEGLVSAIELASVFASSADPNQASTLLMQFSFPAPPIAADDVFAQALMTMVTNDIDTFLSTQPVVAGGSLSPDEAFLLNNIENPEPISAYQDYVAASHLSDPDAPVARTVFGKTYLLSLRQIAAVDGVARTLWGEQRGCQMLGLATFEFVGLVIANRAVAVQYSLNHPDQPQGLQDFGIPGSTDLPAVQVISKPAQFSSWTSYWLQEQPLSSLAPAKSIVDHFSSIDFPFKLPVDSSDESNLINVLCPEISTNLTLSRTTFGWPLKSVPVEYNIAWSRAIDLATLVVADPDRYRQLFAILPTPDAPIFYFTDGVKLKQESQQGFTGLSFIDPENPDQTPVSLPIASKTGSCSTLEIFSAPPGTTYGLDF